MMAESNNTQRRTGFVNRSRSRGGAPTPTQAPDLSEIDPFSSVEEIKELDED